MLVAGSAPPSFAATRIERDSLVNSLPRLASAAPFLRLIVDHLLCPDTVLLPDELVRNRSCTRVSSVSSGWNDAHQDPSLARDTGCPSTSARIATPGPASATHGARMNTA